MRTRIKPKFTGSNRDAMKRIILVCSLMLLNFNVMAQYYKSSNYKPILLDEFVNNQRYWNSETYLDSDSVWKACLVNSVTHGKWEHQVYQKSQSVFDTINDMMLLVSDYVSDTNMLCNDFEVPQDAYCDNNIIINENYQLRYFSGILSSIEKKFLYGYFEIRCKLPVHNGAFPAFWLWGACKEGEYGCNNPHYEEIDIFEYTWGITNPSVNQYSIGIGDNRCFTAGLYYNTTGSGEDLFNSCSVAKIYSRIPDSSPSMDEWNTFGCLWLPDRVEWYINDKMVNSYYNQDSIPRHEMYLIANYAINEIYSTENDTMFIDYIRVYQPICDCETSVLIDTQSDLNNYEPGIKRSVTINSNSSTPITVGSQDDVSIIASESIVIDKPFKVNAGAKFTTAIQQCPY